MKPLRRETPASRAQEHGVAALSTAEILGAFVPRNTHSTSTEIGQRLLRSFDGSLRLMAAAPLATLTNGQPGIGLDTATKIRLALELGKRMAAEERPEGAPVRWPRDVYQLMSPKLEDLAAEEFHVLVLDSQHRVERDITATRGLLNSSLVHPREVFREAIAERAAAIILVHNHPSGDPTPSPDDRVVTEQLVQAGKVLDIPVQDHVIIGRGRYTSFAEAGLL